MKNKFVLGSTVKCIVSGFTGIAVARLEYLNGCTQYGIKAPVGSDQKFPDNVYIDQEQLELVDTGVISKIHSRPGGGPETKIPNRI